MKVETVEKSSRVEFCIDSLVVVSNVLILPDEFTAEILDTHFAGKPVRVTIERVEDGA